MRILSWQFFLIYGSAATLGPYMALFLRDRGFGEIQIGHIIGFSGWAIMLSPVVITGLADLKASPKWLLGGLSLLAALSVGGILVSVGYWPILAFFFLFTLSYAAMSPLLDGLFFGVKKSRSLGGGRELHYTDFRVWGTYGYVVLLLLMFFPIRQTGAVSAALLAGLICYILIALGAMFIPEGQRDEVTKKVSVLPSKSALVALLRRRSVLFTVAMFLLICVSAGFHAIYPVYVVEELGLPSHWMSIVLMLGSIVEIFWILGVKSFEMRWGQRAVMLGAVFLTVVRFALLYAFPSLAVAVSTELLHGAMICAMFVIPPSVLDDFANDGNRNSIQGVFTMLVIGGGRLVGAVLTGYVAEWDHRAVYLLYALITTLALAILWVGFRPGVKEKFDALDARGD
ncbi:MFS transporter [Puniceicoccaceae bacterium K14]|nr:MFS transporter [Puniceicoccaceae bacterium K14]